MFNKLKASRLRKKASRQSFDWIYERVTKNAHILDIGGVGGGWVQDLTVRLLKRGDSVVEVDLVKPMVDFKNLYFHHGNILNFNLDTKFDVIIAIHIMQHIGKPYRGNSIIDENADIKFVDIINKHLASNGIVFIEVPIAPKAQLLKWDDNHTWQIYDIELLKKLFCDFEIVDYFEYDGARQSRERIPGTNSITIMLRKKINYNAIKYPEFKKRLPLSFDGHNLSIIKYNGEYLGYLSGVKFEGVKLLKGNDLENLTVQEGYIIPNSRTATAIVLDNKVHLYCAEQQKLSKDFYRYQNIAHYISSDGENFIRTEEVFQGSAPFIFKTNDNYYLYYHCITEKTHDIRVMNKGTFKILASCNHPLSMPSMMYLNGFYWLTCEEMIGIRWQTVLFRSDNPDGVFTKIGVLLDHPCVYQHDLDGKQFITYSINSNGKWTLAIRGI